MTLRIGSVFSGYGGLDMACEAFFGARTVWHCEVDPNPAKVLAARWPGVPNLGDITAVDWAEVEPVDILVGGFPCTDVSVAGAQAGMIDGTRSGLWSEFREAIARLRPSVVVIENVRGLFSAWGAPPHDGYLTAVAEDDRWDRIVQLIDHKITKHPGDKTYVARKQRERVRCARHHKRAVARRQREDRLIPRAFPVVLAELSDLGFDAEWHSLRASDIGAPHARFRVFIVAYARGFRPKRDWGPWGRGEGLVVNGRALADTGCVRLDQGRNSNAGETPGGWAPAVPGGHSGSPVTLLPTPNAAVSNDGEGIDTWEARRRAVKAASGANNGMPLSIAVQLMPTPTTQPDTGNGHARSLGKEARLLPTPGVADAEGGHATRSGDRADELLLPGLAVAAQAGHLVWGEDITVEDDEYVLLPTPRAARGASATETMYKLGGERDDTGDRQGNVSLGAVSAWGPYGAAVRRWEHLTRPAPPATLPDGRGGAQRLNPAFPEWMLGLPPGFVTDILPRPPALKAIGNGVCPQQAYEAIHVMWPRVIQAVAA